MEVKEYGSTKTNSNGEFLLKDIPAGLDIVYGSAPGYSAANKQADIIEGETTEGLLLELKRSGKVTFENKSLQEGDNLRRVQLPDSVAAGPSNLVGRPLNEVERYYIEKALEITGGNREEAAKRLGIGERTLYRVIQDWKVQDKNKAALTEAGGDLEKASEALGQKLPALQRKMKKWGMGESGQWAAGGGQ